MRITYINYPNAYVKVADLMRQLPRPKLKKNFIVNDGEVLQIITVVTGI